MSPLRRVPWIALGLAVAVGLALLVAPLLRGHPGLLRPCTFKALTGIPCLGCGLTRCVLALTEGRIAEAFRWHPVATALLLASPLLGVWDLRRAWLGRPYPPLPEGRVPRFAAALLLASAWVLQIARGI